MCARMPVVRVDSYIFFNETATTEIYTLSLHDALPICRWDDPAARPRARGRAPTVDVVLRDRRHGRHRAALALGGARMAADRKSTRLNSSHANISYAVFCLKKKNWTPHPVGDV